MPDDAPGNGGTIFGVDRNIVYVGGAALLGAGYLFYRHYKNSQSSNASTTNGSAYGSPLPGAGAITPIFIQPTITTPGVTGPPGPSGPPGKTGPPGPPAKAPPKPAPPPPKKPVPKSPAPNRTYTVQKGDTLIGIAKKFYGNGNLWQRIYAANKAVIGNNPNLIRPGEVLKIP